MVQGDKKRCMSEHGTTQGEFTRRDYAALDRVPASSSFFLSRDSSRLDDASPASRVRDLR